jgi:hypothetical protein
MLKNTSDKRSTHTGQEMMLTITKSSMKNNFKLSLMDIQKVKTIQIRVKVKVKVKVKAKAKVKEESPLLKKETSPHQLHKRLLTTAMESLMELKTANFQRTKPQSASRLLLLICLRKSHLQVKNMFSK